MIPPKSSYSALEQSVSWLHASCLEPGVITPGRWWWKQCTYAVSDVLLHHHMETRKPERLHDPLPGALVWYYAFGFHCLLDYPTPVLGKGSTLSLGVSLVLPWWGFQVLITFWRSLRFCIFIFGVFWRVEQFLYYGSFFLPPHTGEDLVWWIWFSNLCK